MNMISKCYVSSRKLCGSKKTYVLLNHVIFNKISQLYLARFLLQATTQFIKRTVHNKTVLRLAEVLSNGVILHERSRLYLALKMNMISKCSSGVLLEDTTWFIKQML